MTAPQQAPPQGPPGWRPSKRDHNWALFLSAAASLVFAILAINAWHTYNVATSTLLGALAYPHPFGYLVATVVSALISAGFAYLAWTMHRDG